MTMDPTIETLIDKTVADPSIAAKIKGTSQTVNGKTMLNLSALIDSSNLLRRCEPQFVSWVSGLGFDWKAISEETKGGLLDAYRDSGSTCNFMHALPESMKTSKAYKTAYKFGLDMAVTAS
ncbi:hypothetical protein [Amaricoccus macauensis]|uniref:hypothetical protein n=1 Tax=Amaricoccus macauensis TaxID=57001 RepID=UPI003C7C83BB